MLLKYLQIADERDLPELWNKWANCTKRQEFHVLQDTLAAFARSNAAYLATSPVVTAKLVKDLLNFQFVGDSADDIKAGLHPFVISDGNTEHRQSNLEVACLYGLQTSGDTNCSLADLEALKDKEKRLVPLTYWELEKTLGMFGNLISVVLGLQHPLTTAYQATWTLLKSSIRDDFHSAIEYKSYVKPTHIMRSIQLGFYSICGLVIAGRASPCPCFQYHTPTGIVTSLRPTPLTAQSL
jgi:hypothetical protein